MSVPFIIPDVGGLDDTALKALLIQAKTLAQPVVSQFSVAALAIGTTGTGYIGVNIEFTGLPLSQTIHAEQFAVALARAHGEIGLIQLIVTELPCGHCRQFLLELGQSTLPIHLIQPDLTRQTTLDALLPQPFMLANAGQNALQPMVTKLVCVSDTPDSLTLMAMAAAERSYVPYTQAYCGVALATANGQCFAGNVIESAAYNPTMPALQSAIVQVLAAGLSLSTIQRVSLAESNQVAISALKMVEVMLYTLNPMITLKFEALIRPS